MKDIPFAAAEKAYNSWIEDANGCYISTCTRAVSRYSVYAQVRWYEPPGRNRGTSAHRAAWFYAHGPIPDGMEVDHRPTCDRRCVNIDHLQLLPASENHRGDRRRGRRRKGQILTMADAVAIRAAVEAGERQYLVAKKYGITKQQVWQIKEGRAWKP